VVRRSADTTVLKNKTKRNYRQLSDHEQYDSDSKLVKKRNDGTLLTGENPKM